MKNVTLSFENEIIEAGRKYAREHHTTLNNLIRQLLKQTVSKQSNEWLEENFQLMDRAKGHSCGTIRREDLHRV